MILTAALAYMASEDPEFSNREKRVMPQDEKGETVKWPEVKESLEEALKIINSFLYLKTRKE